MELMGGRRTSLSVSRSGSVWAFLSRGHKVTLEEKAEAQ